MGQILNYDTVINARASGQYYDAFIMDSHYNGSWSWQTGTSAVLPQNGWVAMAENRFGHGQTFNHSFGVPTLASGGVLFSGNSAYGAPLPAIPVPTGGRQRWLTYVETTLLPPGLIVCDLLWACKHAMSALSATGTSPTLRRYADGAGVQIVAYPSALAMTRASETLLTITYTNQDGVTNRTATAYFKATAPMGSCASGRFYGGKGARVHETPFVELQQGDTGVRAITGITIAATDSTITMIVALVKPLVSVTPKLGSSLRSEDLLAKPEGPVELVVGSDGQHGAPFMLVGSPISSWTAGVRGLTRLATVEV